MALSEQTIKPLARAGYAARGVVYGIIGLFTVLAAIGLGGDGSMDTKDALDTLLNQPFGTVLVGVLVVGLVGYSLWRGIQSLFDTDHHGLGAKGLAVRAGLFASAVTYTVLAVYALSRIGLFTGGLGGGEGTGSGGQPVADALAGFVGAANVSLVLAIVFAGVAIAHFYKALKQKYERYFQTDQKTMQTIHPIAMGGLIARGIVLAVISALLIGRYLTAGGGGGETPGLDDALTAVRNLPLGEALLGFLGVGLIAFAAYSFAEARYRRINVENA